MALKVTPLLRMPVKNGGVVVDNRVLPLPIDHYEVLRQGSGAR